MKWDKLFLGLSHPLHTNGEKILMLMIENSSINVNEISRQVDLGTTTLT
ncbi:MAG: hypothetical protein K2K09_04570 [Lachnospiraceae bacterium]|nr:hypothetical protein [Lachnospiraceae bacterium]